MLPPEESQKALMKMFRKKHIADLDQLFITLETNSRMSVFRRLKQIGYTTSFTNAGRYYTLQGIPVYDSWGLWFHRGVGFSKAGTLKAAITEIVDSSKAGMTPKELLHLLKIQAPNTLHNALRGLVRSENLHRRRLQGRSLYTSAHPDKAQKQVDARVNTLMTGGPSPRILSTETTIAVLVEALNAGKVITAPSMIAARMSVRGLVVTEDQVTQVFIQYGICAEKKTMKRR